MLVTLSGIVIDASLVQPSKAECPMLATPSGIVIDVSPEQPLKAELANPLAPVKSREPERMGMLLVPTTHPSTSLTPGMQFVSNNSSGHPENAKL